MPQAPRPAEPFDFDTYTATWPSGATKVELDDGHPYYYGAFDHHDAEAARRAFPGRPVSIDPWGDTPDTGNLIIHWAGCTPETCDLWARAPRNG